MGECSEGRENQEKLRVINLLDAPGDRKVWGRPAWLVYLWGLIEAIVVTNPLQVSSRLRVAVLRLFGAEIGADVVFRPRTRVKFPWKLRIGDRSWIGEGVWIHNQDYVSIGSDSVVSQETFITTGSHDYRSDMALTTLPVVIDDGAWITSRCIVLGGSHLGASSVVTPNSVIRGSIKPGTVSGTPSAVEFGNRFERAQ